MVGQESRVHCTWLDSVSNTLPLMFLGIHGSFQDASFNLHAVPVRLNPRHRHSRGTVRFIPLGDL